MFAQLLHVFSLLYGLHDTFYSIEVFKFNVLNLAYFSLLSMQRNTRKMLIGSLNWRQAQKWMQCAFSSTFAGDSSSKFRLIKMYKMASSTSWWWPNWVLQSMLCFWWLVPTCASWNPQLRKWRCGFATPVHPPPPILGGNHLGGECCNGQFRQHTAGHASSFWFNLRTRLPKVHGQHLYFHSASFARFRQGGVEGQDSGCYKSTYHVNRYSKCVFLLVLFQNR